MARATLPGELEAPTLRQGRPAGIPFLYPASRLNLRETCTGCDFPRPAAVGTPLRLSSSAMPRA
jgi:hypothetical protein